MTAPMPRQYSNFAVKTTIQSTSFGVSATQLVVASNSGYPSTYPFTLRINPGAANEEDVDVTSGFGTVSTPWVVTRAVDGTSPNSWTQGTPVSHGFTARDFREIQQTLSNAQSLISNSLPVGAIILWYGAINSIPTKYAACDGGTYSTVDGSPKTQGQPNTITVPDLREVFVLGASSGGHQPGATGGAAAMTAANMPLHNHNQLTSNEAHTHDVVGGAHSHNLNYRAASVDGSGKSFSSISTAAASGTTSGAFPSDNGGHTHGVTATAHSHQIASNGGGNPSENNMPPYRAVVYICRVTT